MYIHTFERTKTDQQVLMWVCSFNVFFDVQLCVTVFHVNRKKLAPLRLHSNTIHTEQVKETSVCPCRKPGAGRADLLNLGRSNRAMLGQCGAPLKSVIVMSHTLKCHIAKPQKGTSTLVLEKCYFYYFHRN